MDAPPRWSQTPLALDDLALAANDVQRVVLSVLSAGEAMPVPALATAVAANTLDIDPATVTRPERRRYHLALEHVHLPALAAGGVVAVGEQDSIVTPLDSWLLEEPAATLLDPDSDVSTDEIRAISDERPLLALEAVEHAGTALAIPELAGRVTAAERGCSPAAVPDSDRRRCRIDLHHRHVPRLVDVGLLVRVGDGAPVRVDGVVPEPIATLLDAASQSAESLREP